jgi:hypothetical protein
MEYEENRFGISEAGYGIERPDFSIISYDLNKAGLDSSLVSKLADIGVTTFGNGMQKSEVIEHIANNDFLVVAYKGDAAIGFSGLKLLEDSAYLSAAVVEIGFQCRWHL